ncbi:unnamed protein product [Lampetra planeri]
MDKISWTRSEVRGGGGGGGGAEDTMSARGIASPTSPASPPPLLANEGDDWDPECDDEAALLDHDDRGAPGGGDGGGAGGDGGGGGGDGGFGRALCRLQSATATDLDPGDSGSLGYTEDPVDFTEPRGDSPGTRAWATVGVLFFINLLNYMDRFTVSGVLAEIQTFFNIDNSLSGLIPAVFLCSYMILAPLFGFLGDRYPRKFIIAASILVWSGTTLGGSFVQETEFAGFLVSRALVGVGEAGYSTVAATILGDLFVGSTRTRVLALYYSAIPIGSGLGYIVGSKIAEVTGDWRNALRVTPGLGLLACVLVVLVVVEPERGAVEQLRSAGGGPAARPRTTWFTDVRMLCSNRSLVLSSLGFTCVSFVSGALALWSPLYLELAAVVRGSLQPCEHQPCPGFSSVSVVFGALTCCAGLAGVALGSEAARRWRRHEPSAEPLVCGLGLLASGPFLYAALLLAKSSPVTTYVFIFLGEVLLFLNWALIADIMLFVVVPTRRSTANSLQMLLCHLLGDAGSPFLIGKIADLVQRSDSWLGRLEALLTAQLCCPLVCVLGAACFLATALVLPRDRTPPSNMTSQTSAPPPPKTCFKSL